MLYKLSSSVKNKRRTVKNAIRTYTFCDWHAGAFALMILFARHKQLLMSLYRFYRQITKDMGYSAAAIA